MRHWVQWLCPDGLWTTCARVVGVSSVQVHCGRGVVATGPAQCPSTARRSSCEALGTLVMPRWTVHDMCPCGRRVVSSRALWSRCGCDRAPLSASTWRVGRHVRHWVHWLCPDGLWTTCARVVGVSSVHVLCGRDGVATGPRSVRPHGEAIVMRGIGHWHTGYVPMDCARHVPVWRACRQSRCSVVAVVVATGHRSVTRHGEAIAI